MDHSDEAQRQWEEMSDEHAAPKGETWGRIAWPVEVDSRGREHSEHDPQYWIITDKDGHILCDTLNADHRFEPMEHRAHMHDLATAINTTLRDPSPITRGMYQACKDANESWSRRYWTFKGEVKDVLCNVAQLLDGKKIEGCTWSEWDQSIRDRISELLSECEDATAPDDAF